MCTEDAKVTDELKKRDHRAIGVQQRLFYFEPQFSPGSCFWLPEGAKVYNKLCDFLRREYIFRGFQEVVTPNVYNGDLFKVSGHYQCFKNDMFILNCEGKEWALKPMNCPGHCLMFKHLAPSYRQLPIRFADFGVLHRNELSGALSGLTRVRRFQQDDAHIFARVDQLKCEVSAALEFLFFVYDVFGFHFELELSTRPAKALGAVELWNEAESQLADALKETGRPWQINEGDGAFYGPKIDVKIRDALDRWFQCGTIQLDFQLPLRFNLQYRNEDQAPAGSSEEESSTVADPDSPEEVPSQGADGSLEQELKPGYSRPVIIHRAILGSVERMTAVLLEHTAGRLPFWLSPRQALVCPITSQQIEYATYIRDVLKAHGFDSKVDDSTNTISKKIREAQVEQWNYILVVGAQEVTSQTITVRLREDSKKQLKVSLQELIDMFKKEADVADRNKLTDSVPPFVPSAP